jgi:hypothetical protein
MLRQETNMRKIIVATFTSLDGVVQAPGGSQEDPPSPPTASRRKRDLRHGFREARGIRRRGAKDASIVQF